MLTRMPTSAVEHGWRMYDPEFTEGERQVHASRKNSK
jgi:hypothetical protein